jgi:hypothetical protein
VKIVGTATAGAAGGSNTQVQFNSSGVLAGSANMTFNGTILTAAGFSGPLNGTVGATTATTGAFTTLTTSSTVTLSGGTANGVTYLNGSKVLTSGSALTFDGTDLQVANGGFYVANGSGTNLSLGFKQASTLKFRFRYDIAGESLAVVDGSGNFCQTWAQGNTDTRWNIAGVGEAMRLNSTGLGIGTSSPSAKLDITSASGGFSNIKLVQTGVRTWAIENTATSGLFKIIEAGVSDRLVIDGSGNLGLGVTPSAWYTSFGTKAFQFAASGSVHGLDVSSSDRRVALANNDFINTSGADTYINTGHATKFQQVAGAFQFYTAASGTAGNAISFTQAMTLDADGDLGIGVTSPAYKLDIAVVGTASYSSSSAPTPNIFLGTTGAANSRYTSIGINCRGTSGQSQTNYITSVPEAADGNAALAFSVYGGYAAVERARITSGGQLLVGNTTTSGGEIARFQTASGATSVGIIAATNGSSFVNFGDTSDANVGFIGYDHTSNYMNFRTNGAEAARIDSSGNLLVGTTSSAGGYKLKVIGDSSSNTGFLFDKSASSTGAALEIDVGSSNTTQKALIVYSGSAGADRLYIYSNGNVVNTNNSYGAISDVKLKENIVDASSKLADLMQVKVRNYNLIGESTKQLGVVAQELETVFPAMVDKTPDRDTEGNELGTITKSVKYSVFVPMLIKAIQEQQAIIESLKARLDAANL